MKSRITIKYKGELFKKTDYLLIFLLLQIGILLLLLNLRRLDLLLVPILFYISYRRNQGKLFDTKFFILFLIFIFLATVQGVIFGSFSIITIITSFSLICLVPYFLFKIYKSDFFFLFEKVVRVLVYISLIIWLLQQFVPGVKEIILSVILLINKYNILDFPRFMFFYTYWPGLDQDFGLSRNAGFSNEPAAFSVIIILAIIINYARNIQMFDKRNLIYYLALLSTFSTAGYIAFSVLGLLLLKQKRYRILGVLLFPIFIFIASYAYKNLEFMQEKIEFQYSSAMEQDLNQYTTGRIYGARKSLLVLSKYPLTGRGLQARTKPKEDDPEYANYGWLAEMSKFGILFGALFMFYFLKGFKQFIEAGGHGFYEFAVCALSIMIILTAQNGITNFIFMVFFFIGLYNYRNNYKPLQINRLKPRESTDILFRSASSLKQ